MLLSPVVRPWLPFLPGEVVPEETGKAGTPQIDTAAAGTGARGGKVTGLSLSR